MTRHTVCGGISPDALVFSRAYKASEIRVS